MSLFQLGEVTLSSGSKSFYKIDCDYLTERDIQCLVQMITKLVGPFGSVEGIPRGGLRLADQLKRYLLPTSSIHLIVDDVLTTGKSMEEARKVCKCPDIIGSVIFARGKCPDWVRPLFQLPAELWQDRR